jgi:hypothetical protein
MAYGDEQLGGALQSALTSGNVPRTWYFMTAGTEGNMENRFRAGAERADSIYKANPDDRLIWQYARYDSLGHMHTPVRSLSEGFQAFAKFWFVNDEKALAFLADSSQSFLTSIQEHLAYQSEWLGKPISMGAEEINTLGYVACYEEAWAAALPVFEWGIALYPNDPNLYDSKAEAVENTGNLEAALSFYQKASEVLEGEKDSLDPETYTYYAEIFAEHAKKAQEKLGIK